MLADLAAKMAHVVTAYCLDVCEGELVSIAGERVAEPLIEAAFEAVLRCGGHPHVEMIPANLHEIYMRRASDTQLNTMSPIDGYASDTVDARIVVRATTNTNTNTMSNIDPQRVSHWTHARSRLFARRRRRKDAGELRWTICPWPTPSAAQAAEMGFLEYAEFVYKACGLDQDDPVAHWQAFRDCQMRLVAWLADKRHAEVRGPGIEMSFDFGGRSWISSHGHYNFPDGEIFTSPIEDSVNGWVAFSYPSVYGGREVSGVRLTFKDGKVVDASAQKGEAHLLAQLNADDGSRRLGEFAVGTNFGIQRFTRNTLFDEKIGGTIHMALGRGFAEAGGSNKSVVHWDMVHGMMDGGEILIDDQLYYQSGKFMIEGMNT